VYKRQDSVDQAGLELRNPPASASQVLGLKACATTARQESGIFLTYNSSYSLLYVYSSVVLNIVRLL
jgi:biotin carboxylase